jgi:hypothetical protein
VVFDIGGEIVYFAVDCYPAVMLRVVLCQLANKLHETHPGY